MGTSNNPKFWSEYLVWLWNKKWSIDSSYETFLKENNLILT